MESEKGSSCEWIARKRRNNWKVLREVWIPFVRKLKVEGRDEGYKEKSI